MADGTHDEDPEARARQVCLRLLTLAPRTRAQLADALKKRGIPDEVAHDVLHRFTDAGLIDDAAFAAAWVESRHHGRGLSAKALSAELRKRGVDDDQIQGAVGQLGPDAEVEMARLLVRKKLAATRGQPATQAVGQEADEPGDQAAGRAAAQAAQQRTRRLAGMLARKGYPPGLAFRVIREALEAAGMEAEGMEVEWDEALDDDPPVE